MFHESKTNSDMVEAFTKQKLVLQKHSSLGMFFNTAGGKRIKLDDSQQTTTFSFEWTTNFVFQKNTFFF